MGGTPGFVPNRGSSMCIIVFLLPHINKKFMDEQWSLRSMQANNRNTILLYFLVNDNVSLVRAQSGNFFSKIILNICFEKGRTKFTVKEVCQFRQAVLVYNVMATYETSQFINFYVCNT